MKKIKIDHFRVILHVIHVEDNARREIIDTVENIRS